MDFETELMNLKNLVQKQQEQICSLEQKIDQFDKEFGVLNEEIYLHGQVGHPSLHDVKEKFVEKGWLI